VTAHAALQARNAIAGENEGTLMGDRASRNAGERRAVSPLRNKRAARTRCVAVAVLIAALAADSAVADRCATPSEMASLRVAAFQQQLMVAALTCHRISSYNRFVRAYRPSLINSDRNMLRLFLRLDGTDGDADYNAYKTRLANLAVLRNNASGGGYCREAREDFAAAASNRRPLADFVATRHLDVRLPYEACDSEAPTVEEATKAPAPRRRHRHGRAHLATT
jgi:hypothetical protein